VSEPGVGRPRGADSCAANSPIRRAEDGTCPATGIQAVVYGHRACSGMRGDITAGADRDVFAAPPNVEAGSQHDAATGLEREGALRGAGGGDYPDAPIRVDVVRGAEMNG